MYFLAYVTIGKRGMSPIIIFPDLAIGGHLNYVTYETIHIYVCGPYS